MSSDKTFEIMVPNVGVNDDKVTISEIKVQAGDKVTSGES